MIATPSLTTIKLQPGDTFTRPMSWGEFKSVAEHFTEQPGMRLAYSEGALQLMITSQPHERIKKLLGNLILAIALKTGQPIASFGSSTFMRDDLEKGFESDECYWIQNENSVRGRTDVDLAIDPPPDLIVEVDFASSSRLRLEIYRVLGVQEVWLYRNEQIRILVLNAGSYEETVRSIAFSAITQTTLQSFLEAIGQYDETSLILQFVNQV